MYALNRDRDDVLKSKRESRDHKKATSSILSGKSTLSKTPVAISPGMSIFSVLYDVAVTSIIISMINSF